MVASLSLLAIAARELAPRHNPMELQVVRHGLSLLILAPFVIRAGLRSFQTTNIKLQLLRNVSHFAATIGWYIAVTLLPLAEVFAIEFTTPVWVAVLAVIFLGEKMNGGRMVALILGIAGILVILRPGFNDVGLGTWTMVAAAFGFAVANACTKGLTRNDSEATIPNIHRAPRRLSFTRLVHVSSPQTTLFLQWIVPLWRHGLLCYYVVN